MPDALPSFAPVYPAGSRITLADFASPLRKDALAGIPENAGAHTKNTKADPAPHPPSNPNIFWPRQSPAFSKLRHAARSLPRQPYVVGVSGGADSMALAAAMVAENYEVYALSVDHQLQAGSTAVSQRAIRQLRQLGAHGAVVQVEIEPGENIEAAARTARYAALSTPGLDVVVAHTRNDQAETALLQLLRANLSAMQTYSTLRAPQQQVGLYRPLLNISRQDTAQAAQELQLEIWQDPHNADTNFRRVALRKEVLPLLAEITGGDPTTSIAQAAQLAQQRQDYIAQVAAEVLEEVLGPETATTSQLRVGSIVQHHQVIIQETLQLWLRRFGIAPTQAQRSALLSLLLDWHGQGKIALSGGWAVYRRKSILHLGK